MTTHQDYGNKTPGSQVANEFSDNIKDKIGTPLFNSSFDVHLALAHTSLTLSSCDSPYHWSVAQIYRPTAGDEHCKVWP
jgi:hypothetical protein